MPKGFTDREKELIRKRLFTEGSRLFGQFGIQKTTVDEIAKACGISKGSFYSFYPSKEELFFDILESLDHESKDRLSGDIFPEGKSKRESFKLFLIHIFDLIMNTPVMKMLNPSELENLMRKLPEEKLTSHLNHDNDYFAEFYLKWKDRGVFREVDPKGFTGNIKLLFYLSLHQTEYSPVEFLASKEFFIDMLCSYLVKE